MSVSEKALEKIIAMRTQAEINAANNSDEQALAVKSLYPDWVILPEGYSLAEGARVNYGETLYRVLQGHKKQKNWNPADASSLFTKVLIPDSAVIPQWEQPDATNGYAKGDRVSHREKNWESQINDNIWEPGAAGTEKLWEEM